MRTLEKNKTVLWMVDPASKVPYLDSNGFDTGETTTTFETPVKIRLGLYPANGSITEQIFGKDYSCDQVAISESIVLKKDTLLFTTQPSSNYSTTYDYRVDRINQSLNVYNYALVKRT